MNNKSRILFFLCLFLLLAPMLRLGMIRDWYSPETNEVYVLVNLINKYDSKISDVGVRIYIPDLGQELYARTTRDITLGRKETDSRVVVFSVPNGAKPGLYLAKVTATSDSYRDTKFTYLYVGSPLVNSY